MSVTALKQWPNTGTRPKSDPEALAPTRSGEVPASTPARLATVSMLTLALLAWRTSAAAPTPSLMDTNEIQVTRDRRGHILTNTGVWSPDSQWIVYDTRSDPAGDRFDGSTIEMVHVLTGEVRTLYTARHGAHCGVVTFHPLEPKVVFILGPEDPSPDWQYGPSHRQGVIVDTTRPEAAANLDARDLTPPLTPGALRGGSHVHVWDAAGAWVSFTYEDHLLAQFSGPTPSNDINQRNVGVAVPGRPVRVDTDHPRNHPGEYFSVLATRTTARPTAGSDEINKAFEEGWVGTNGYVRPDGSRQLHALAFQGQLITAKGDTLSEVFIVDLPTDLTVSGDGPLAGTLSRRPTPPSGALQRRLTHTADRRFPGIQGPRHWLRSSPDGARIAFLMKDSSGIAQLWTVSPNGGPPQPLSHNPWPIASTFTWNPEGRLLAHVMDNSVCVTDARTGQTSRLTHRTEDARAPRPEACVFSPDGTRIAYVRQSAQGGEWHNQIFVIGVQKNAQP